MREEVRGIHSLWLPGRCSGVEGEAIPGLDCTDGAGDWGSGLSTGDKYCFQ